MRSLTINIIFVFFAILNSVNSNLPNGAPCTLKNGTAGVCVEISSCPIVRNQLARRLINRSQVTVCNKPKRFLCCPSPPAEEETTIEPILTHFNQGIRISERKCKEYGEKVLQKVMVSSLIINEQGLESTTSKCQHKSVSLIIGGTEASLNEFPHQALLGYLNGISIEWNCGGSLVSPRFVLTAAHCFNHADFGKVKFAKLGMHNRVHNNDKTYTFGVEEYIRHPNYLRGSFNNDIGLLKLDGIVPIDEHILPICMPTKQHDDFTATATGFGKTQYQHQSNVLMKVTVEKFNHSECRSSWGEDSNVRIDAQTMLCYGDHTERKDSCRGDSGGPLQVSNEERVHCTYTQIGIISFGPAKCGLVGVASGYVNVYHYLDWIEGIVWKDEE
ncbi:venom protease-like [Chironomus tepperi]|uniref:venom protease-like n=1 Tax=Chironomus tepperi TaxID=113505 RepID=UPI00391F8C86